MKLDLHIHTNCSDGSDDWRTILQKAEQLGLEYISLTDHDNVDVYFQMKNPEKIFSGKIINGIELTCFYYDRGIELLGYDIDIDKMKNLLKGLYLPREQINQEQFKRFYANLVNGGVKFSPDILDTWRGKKNCYASSHLHADLIKYPENKKFITDDGSWNNSLQLYRNYASKKSSPFWINESNLYPSAETIYKLIKQTGGKVFIPHIFSYGEDSLPIFESLIKEFQIDGIECFYNSFTEAQTNFLLSFCNKNNLFVSAGSDYHGTSRPHVKLGVDNLKLKEHIKWL